MTQLRHARFIPLTEGRGISISTGRFYEPVVKRTCRYGYCGRPFTPSHGNQEYCSPRCRLDANHRKARPLRDSRVIPDTGERFYVIACTGFKINPASAGESRSRQPATSYEETDA